MSDLLQVKLSMENDFALLKTINESNLSKLKSLELLNDVSLVRVENSSVTVRFLSRWTESHVLLQFVYSTNGFLSRSTLNHDCPVESNSHYLQLFFSEQVKEYLDQRISLYFQQLHDKIFPSCYTVQEIILNVGSFMNRLQLIGNEISKLLRRFTGKLSWSDDFDVLWLSLLFVHRKNTSKSELVACFRLDLSYPYSPLEVDLSGDVNTEDLEQHLIKNSKPGIGYLTRSCDVISGFIRSYR